MSSISVKQEPGGEGETARGVPGAGAALGACKEEPGISTEWMEHVKEEPTYLNLENVGSCTEAAVLAGQYTDHASSCMEAAALAGQYTDHASSCMEAAALAGQYTDHASSCMEAAALAGLYTDHAVKDQLVLGPESMQHPKGASFSGVISLELACFKQEAAVKPEPAWEWEESEPEWEGLASAWEGPDVCVKMEQFADAAEWGEEGESGGRRGRVGAASESETNTRAVKQASRERIGRPPVRRPLRPPRPAPPRPPAAGPTAPPARPPDYSFAHACPHCGKGFRNQFVFTRHLFTHKSLKPRKTPNKTQSKPLKCSHCKFKSRDALVWRQHQSLHDHDVKKPSTKFRCGSCDFTCGRRTELRRHSRTLHDRLTCNTSSCGYTTRRVTTLRRHQATCHCHPTPT